MNMNRNDWAVLACRILALYLWAAVIQSVQSTTYLLSRAQLPEVNMGYWWVFSMLVLCYVMFGVVLWRLAGPIARRIFPDSSPSSQTIVLDRFQVAHLAVSIVGLVFAVLGVYWLVSGIAQIVNILIFVEESGHKISISISGSIGRMVCSAVQIVVGLYLMFSTRVPRMLRFVRTGEEPMPSREEGGHESK